MNSLEGDPASSPARWQIARSLHQRRTALTSGLFFRPIGDWRASRHPPRRAVMESFHRRQANSQAQMTILSPNRPIVPIDCPGATMAGDRRGLRYKRAMNLKDLQDRRRRRGSRAFRPRRPSGPATSVNRTCSHHSLRARGGTKDIRAFEREGRVGPGRQPRGLDRRARPPIAAAADVAAARAAPAPPVGALRLVIMPTVAPCLPALRAALGRPRAAPGADGVIVEDLTDHLLRC